MCVKKEEKVCIYANFFVTLQPFLESNKNIAIYMDSLKKYLGVILLLLGVVFLVIYKFAAPHNALLVAGLAFEFFGILAYIFINKRG